MEPDGRVAVSVDRDRCQSVRMCIEFAPGAFELDEESLSRFVPDGTWTREQVQEAVENCPSEALTLLIDGVPTDPWAS